jgi:hypothetical protein
VNVLKADKVWESLHRGNSARMPDEAAAKFKTGDKILVKKMNHPGHIRLPEYVQGRRGTIEADQGSFIFPDGHANGIKEAQRLYSVRFESEQLWGAERCDSPSAVFVDLFESYLTSK